MDRSPYGVQDLAGNMREWCQDPFLSSPPSSSERRVRVPDGLSDDISGGLRVQRGGAFDAYELDARLASRGGPNPSFRWASWGFRLARSLGAP